MHRKESLVNDLEMRLAEAQREVARLREEIETIRQTLPSPTMPPQQAAPANDPQPILPIDSEYQIVAANPPAGAGSTHPSGRTLARLESEERLRREKQHALDLELLSRFAADFAAVPLQKDVFSLISSHMRQLAGCSAVMVNSYHAESHRLVVRALTCRASIEEKCTQINGKPAVGTIYDADPDFVSELLQGNLKESFEGPDSSKPDGSTPAARIGITAKELGMDALYTIGLTCGSQLFGNIVLMFSEGETLYNPEVIVAYANMAAGAIQRHIAEQSLQESEQKFHGFIEQASEGIFLINVQGRIVEWNHGMEVITGVEAQEAVGQLVWRIIQKLNSTGKPFFGLSEPAPEDFLKLINTADSSWFYTLHNLDILPLSGKQKSIQVMLFPIPTTDGGQMGVIVHDVTSDNQRQREMEAIISVNKAIRPIITVEDILPIISTQLMSLLNLKGVAISLYDPLTDKNQLQLGDGCWKDLSALAATPAEEIAMQVIQSGEIYLNNNISQKAEKHPPEQRSIQPAAIACLPLATREQVTGTVWIGQSCPIDDESLRIVKIICEITAAAMHRSALYEQLQRRLDHISALRLIDRTIAGNLDLRIGLHVLLDQVVSQLNVDSAAIHLINPRTQNIEYGESRGFQTNLIKQTHLSIGEGLTGRAVLERNILFIPDLKNSADKFTRKELRIQENFTAYCAAPLMIKGEVKGVLELFTRAPLIPTTEWLEFLENLSGQAAIMIDNSELYSRLQQSNLELRLAYSRTLEGWVRALDLRDKETEGHTQRVTEMTLRLALAMGVPDERLVHIQRGALLHDIGKMAVSDDILRKPGKLTEKEWEIMRQHPLVAYELLHPISFLQEALDIPYCHHEQWDGKGYPRGLKGEEIPLAARIFAVVDVWDALSNDRHYRKAWTKDRVRSYLKSNSGKLFDPAVVEAFLELLEMDNTAL